MPKTKTRSRRKRSDEIGETSARGVEDSERPANVKENMLSEMRLSG